MKKWIIIISVCCLFSEVTFAVKHTITTTSSTFSPATTTATVGDIIEFIVGGTHTATQVSQSTWNNNQTTPLSGGFNYNPGTFQYELKASDVGTIYYICIPHVSIGMKGRIIVQAAENVSVTGVTLNKQSTTINVNGSETLIATVAPANATNKNVTWSTSDATVATVNSNGMVTGLKAGSATITVTTQDGAKTATCTVTVQTLNIPVTGVTLNKQSTILSINGSETLIATVAPANATNKNVTWSTSDATVATVNTGGMVTGLKVGSTTITVTTQDGAKTAICAVVVQENIVSVTGITLNKQSITLSVNGSETLIATIIPANATNMNVTWDTGDASVVTVDTSGKLTGLKAGSAIVTVTSLDGGKTASCIVTIEALTGIETVETILTTFYPNPTEELLNMNFKVPGNYTVTLVNALGKRVLNQRISGEHALLDISKFSTGIYFLVIENGKQRHTTKILKK